MGPSTSTAADAAPRLLATTRSGALRGGYRRDYEVSGAAGRCLLQRVRVHVRYHVGSVRVADYRQTYYEFFRFARDDASLVDRHTFDLHHDGWRQSVIHRLLLQNVAPGCRVPLGEPHLLVRKQFVLGPGAVGDARPRELRAGAAFGLLAEGPCGPSRARLSLARGDGSWAHLDDLPPCPDGFAVRGRGTFVAPPRWRAFEQFRHHYANMAGTFVDRGRYLSHPEHRTPCPTP